MSKPILCLDFDGVIHSYTSGWEEADFIPDPPVLGAMQFLAEATQHFRVVVFSSRSSEESGVRAMRVWIRYWAGARLAEPDLSRVITEIVYREDAFPIEKPKAFLTIDDRAIQFTGLWPSMEELKGFKPWNKRNLEIWRHKKRGSTYQVVTERATLQTENDIGDGYIDLVIYRNTETGSYFVRPRNEFMDGRFERVTP